MRERPMIFGPESVRAILAGHKTQTRSVVVPQPHPWPLHGKPVDGASFDASDRLFAWHAVNGDLCNAPRFRCPYGAPGDRLWVKEAWGMSFVDIAQNRPYVEGGAWGSPSRPGRRACVVFKADDGAMPDDSPSETARWCSPLFLPRWASRLTLEVVEVRVQRVQEISESDALAEGVVRVDSIGDGNTAPAYAGPDGSFTNGWSAQSAFARGWDAINAKRGFPWSANPWVWALTFRVVAARSAERMG